MSESDYKTGDFTTDLAVTRREIDEVDVALHDLVRRRAELAQHLGALKARDGGSVPGNPIRPAREAAILRKLASRHSGAPPFAVVVQIWRELIAANLRRQGDFRLAVLETSDGRIRDLAHAAFGTLTPGVSISRPQEVMEVISKDPDMLGVLPAPGHAPPDVRFWPELLAFQDAPRLLCALPPLETEGWPVAFVVGHAPSEPSGEDLSYLLLTGPTPFETGSGALEDTALHGQVTAAWPAISPPGHFCAFAAIQGFIAPADPGLARLQKRQQEEGGDTRLIGTVPAPIREPVGNFKPEGGAT